MNLSEKYDLLNDLTGNSKSTRSDVEGGDGGGVFLNVQMTLAASPAVTA